MKNAALLVLLAILWVAAERRNTQGTAEPEEAIRKVVSDFDGAWNRNDAKAMAGLWTADGDLIQPGGRWTRGRDEIEKRLAEEHAYFYKGSRFSSTVEALRLLKSDVAVVDGAWESAGAHSPEGKELPPLKGLYTLILIKEKGVWRVVSSRTMIPARPPG